ncbi:hypothetical protein B0I35DRAFT_465708 [Stachybotrys elegans]|uniref:Transcription factor domain-containing protein n=1 Tax=Stachybotrys elegans TaxID=80388 RepID=A0A8K0WJG0_9HYPO|nr:hypothetical protein B0I35DRAFT_465708 [Stachybotrys elegans]
MRNENRFGSYEQDLPQIAVDSIQQLNAQEISSATEPNKEPGPDDLSDPSMYPSAEAVCFLSIESRKLAACFHSEIASIISQSFFERMSCALLDEQVPKHRHAEYIACVNFFILTVVVGLEATDKNGHDVPRLRILQSRYRQNAFTALRYISVLNSPSLSLLQALLAGAMLYQMSGYQQKSAYLSALACVTCSQLGGHYFAELAASASEQESLEDRQCLGHCYIIDQSLALSMGRRSFLSEMNVNASVLMPPERDMPIMPIFNIYLQFARIQDDIARHLRKGPALHGLDEDVGQEAYINDLQSRMHEIRQKIRQFRSQPPHCDDSLLQGEWMCVDLTYFNIMTIILRLHPGFETSRQARAPCLESARRALHRLLDVERHGSYHPEI